MGLNRGLKHIEINIGKACNNKCRFCMSSKSELWDIKFVKLEVLVERISEYYAKGYRSIGFLGGDISIHPSIIEIISHCKNLGFESINAISNGMKFDDMDWAKKVVAAGLTRINFSVHSHLEDVEDYLIQVKGGTKRKMQAIDNMVLLNKQGFLQDAVSINIVLNSKNYTTLAESIIYFFAKKKVNDIRVNFIWLNNDTKENWDDLKLNYAEFFPYMKKAIYLSLKYKIRLTFDTVPACILQKVDPKNAKALIKKFLGEDYDHITEIDHINNTDQFDWKQRKKDMLKTQFTHCEKCIYRESCQGIRKNYAAIYGGEEFFPILADGVSRDSIDMTMNKPFSLDDTGGDRDALKQKLELLKGVFNKTYTQADIQEQRINDGSNIDINEYVPEKAITEKNAENNQSRGNDIDYKFYFEKIEKGELLDIQDYLQEVYPSMSNDENFCNLYGVFLSAKKNFSQAEGVYLHILKTPRKITQIGNIYYNLGVNYVNMGNDAEATKYLNLAKDEKGEGDENFMNYYKDFFKRIKKYSYNDFENQVKIMYQNDTEFIEVNNYIDGHIKKLT